MPRKLKEKNKLQTFLDYFSNLDDPRVERNKLFPLDEILLVVLCGTICGAEGWEDKCSAKKNLIYLKPICILNSSQLT
ncbi:MAG: transposase family protein [bacterium]